MIVDKTKQLEDVLTSLSESDQPNYDELTKLIKSFRRDVSGIDIIFHDESLTESIKSAIKKNNTKQLIKELSSMLSKSVRSTKHFSELTLETSNELNVPVNKLFTKKVGSKVMGFSVTKSKDDNYLVKSFSINGDIRDFSNWSKSSTRVMNTESVNDLFND
jgi:vacuolar-type H+-ATPase subunit F/Vma7